MKNTNLNPEDLKSWIAKEQWVTYASESKNDITKRLQVSLGDLKKMVTVNENVVYEGYSETEAVKSYNSY